MFQSISPRAACARVFVEDALGGSGRLDRPGALQVYGQQGVIHGEQRWSRQLNVRGQEDGIGEVWSSFVKLMVLWIEIVLE